MVEYLTQPNTAELILPNEILAKVQRTSLWAEPNGELYPLQAFSTPSLPEIVSETSFLEPSDLVKISSLKEN